MSEVYVTYSELRCQRSSHLQRRPRPEISKGKSPSCFPHLDLSAPSSFWKFTAVILWLICLVLLLFVGILATKLNQKSFQAEDYPGNLSFSREANKTVWKCPSCSSQWHQHGESCYYFSRDRRPWKECNLYCMNSSSRFVKWDTAEEMKFIKQLSKMQCTMKQEKFWIGSFYNSSQLKWVWLDGTTLILNELPGRENASNKCMYVKNGQIFDDYCLDGYCICKKTIHTDQIQ